MRLAPAVLVLATVLAGAARAGEEAPTTADLAAAVRARLATGELGPAADALAALERASGGTAAAAGLRQVRRRAPALDPAPPALLAALDAGPAGALVTTARYAAFVEAVARHGRRAPALLALLAALRPGHPWLASARTPWALRPELDRLDAALATLGVPDPRTSPRVRARVPRLPAPGFFSVCACVDEEAPQAEEDAGEVAAGVLVRGPDGEERLLDDALRPRELLPGTTLDPAPGVEEEALAALGDATLDARAAALCAWRARRLGREAAALRLLDAHLGFEGAIDGVLARLAAGAHALALDDLARGAPAAAVAARLRAIAAVCPVGTLTDWWIVVVRAQAEALPLLADDGDPSPWTAPDWEALGLEERRARLGPALTLAAGVVRGLPPDGAAGGALRSEDEPCPLPGALAPLAAAWDELGWSAVEALLELLGDPRPTRLVDLGAGPLRVGDVAASLLERLLGEAPPFLVGGDLPARREQGRAWWAQHGPRGALAWHRARLRDTWGDETPTATDPHVAALLRGPHRAAAAAWLLELAARADVEDRAGWVQTLAAAGEPAFDAFVAEALDDEAPEVLAAAARALLARGVRPADLDARLAARARALLDAGQLDDAADLLALADPGGPGVEALTLALGAATIDEDDLRHLPPSPARALAELRRRIEVEGASAAHLARTIEGEELTGLAATAVAAGAAASTGDPAVAGDAARLLYALDSVARHQARWPTESGLVALVTGGERLARLLDPAAPPTAALDALGPAARAWLEALLAGRSDAAGRAAAAAHAAWRAEVRRRLRVDAVGAVVPPDVVDALRRPGAALAPATLAAALGELERHGDVPALALTAAPGPEGAEVTLAVDPRREPGGAWTLDLEVTDAGGVTRFAASTRLAARPSAWLEPALAEALDALAAAPGGRLRARLERP